MERKEKTYNGYIVEKGNYTTTPDDRADRWYLDNPYTQFVDHRGQGFATKKEAIGYAMQLPKAKI